MLRDTDISWLPWSQPFTRPFSWDRELKLRGLSRGGRQNSHGAGFGGGVGREEQGSLSGTR